MESSFFIVEGRPILQDETPRDHAVRDWQDAADFELIELAQANEADAFGELYYRHAKRVFRFLYAHINDQLDAEELTSEVFIRAWRTVSNHRDQGIPFIVYLLRIARNVLVDYYRLSARSGEHMSIEDRMIPDNHPDPDESVATQLERQELRKTLERLQEDHRTVLILRFLSGLTAEETGQVMGRTPGAVRLLQQRALSALRNLLEL